VGGESTLFEFQGNKLLERAAHFDSRNSAFTHAFGDQTNIVNTNIIVIEKLVVVVVVEKPRLFETIGCCTVAVCCTAIICALCLR
jgi:hypothetical protein